MGHLVERARHPKVLSGGVPRQLERVHEPRRSRQVPITFVHPAPVDLDEPPESLPLESLDGAMQLHEVLLDSRIGHLTERLRRQRVGNRSEFAHPVLSRIAVVSNIRS
ncbi:MAG TPA: hypothetical protein VK962_02120 [Actinomycetota bacterium]|nr:hypothetical protein [Actinomycetota bacterium]